MALNINQTWLEITVEFMRKHRVPTAHCTNEQTRTVRNIECSQVNIS